ncbi:MAG: hypothetical protein DI623_01775 [Sphingomonas sanxanigenens]|uniref:SGNH/GDSL hydrolase family protein n=1 Tax=Sphingomonas sanxanigenens TaxID=397260 RepID=A0A2W5AB76_9SPHN|nr:MAG: hypothetical protein DI623_01775 [Sphingomonas sanxanigenens]
MMRLHAGRKLIAILATSLLLAIGASLLPENSYQRWQLLDDTIHARARWIYERIHYDPTPIDVAFIGPSRIGAGINAPQLGAALAKRGLPSNVVNFSLPETGRNINDVIVEEMLKTKRPKLLVIGVIEKPSRFGHSAFKYIAPRAMVANPGYFGNINYLPDLAYLPFRQLYLFAADLMPGATGLTKSFDPARYAGSSVDTTGDVVMPDGSIKNATLPASPAELDRGVRKLERGMHPPFLPAALADVEFGDERHFTRRIVAAAKARGIPVVFLALPYHTGPAAVQEQAFYTQFGPLWNASFLAPHGEWYADYGHLTAHGATILTDWLVEPVAAALEKHP